MGWKTIIGVDYFGHVVDVELSELAAKDDR